MSEISKLFKLTATQVATLTAAAAAPGSSANIAVVALVRDNGVSHLQMRSQEAVGVAARGAGTSLMRGATLATVGGHMAVSQSSAAAEQQLLYFFGALYNAGALSIEGSS